VHFAPFAEKEVTNELADVVVFDEQDAVDGLLVGPDDFPEVAVGVAEVAAVDAPGSVMRRRH
jgi:hypothetical protein